MGKLKVPRDTALYEVMKVPATWTYSNWPGDVYPFESQRARHVTKAHEKELTDCGAKVRIGKVVVIVGSEYMRWLKSKGSKVADYTVPANKPEHAHKRFGKHRVEPGAAREAE